MIQAQHYSEIIKIVASDQQQLSSFGYSVDISGDYAIVGAYMQSQTVPFHTAWTGAAYIFKKDKGGIDNWGLVKKIIASDTSDTDFFGYRVAITDGYAIVGAYLNDLDATGNNPISNAGAAYIFKKDEGGVDNWGKVKKITASDREVEDLFGTSVSIHGDYAIVGAINEDEDASGNNTLSKAGSVYIFKKDEGGVDNWGEIKKITASDRGIGDLFGISMSISNEHIIVGAYEENEDANGLNTLYNAGSVYVFKKDEGGVDNWGEVKKITASDRAAYDYFGGSVDISEDYIAVGASWEDENVNGSITLSKAGSVYIFKKDEGGFNNWGEIKKITASDRSIDANFGIGVSLSGEQLLVGAYKEAKDFGGLNPKSEAGAAYLFKKNKGGSDNWGQVTKITPEDRDFSELFGRSVSISGDYSIVGAHQDSEDTSSVKYAGAAYILKSAIILPQNEIAFDKNSIKIFPNPVRNVLNIENGEGIIQVTNLLGQVLISTKIEEYIYSLDVSKLSNGQYIIRNIKKDGEVFIRKFIK